MKSILYPFIVAGLALTALSACNQNSQNTQAAASEAVASAVTSSTPTPVDKEHTAEKLLDWAGTYQGKLPCGSCEYIQTTLVLNADRTYTLSEDYKSSKEPLSAKEQGRFEWEDNGSIIRLKPSNSTDPLDERRYFIAEKHVFQLAEGENKYKENSLYRLDRQDAQ
ncbi:copper resistance protein NlpE [Neisseria wadsworthii]|uniref:Lipoprotein n=1 Tax=Neisseria wadsworthii 9715 TaxID=1030841 RepID=G4CSP8_9NEIS|nr:copper resistance protein NlpE [Neisseria wadsworthii]EGZ44604.1 lipoprotein [Neisseria wadsworthii 9715]QMT35745.1 copper resistance protein NlpE N-terminal domain-containing protein [Neisseria wadsworthii]